MTSNPVDLGQGDRLAGEDTHRLNKPLPVRQEERERIYEALLEYRLSNMGDEDGIAGYPLVDLVSNDPPATIESGREELLLLADHIAVALSASPTPVLMERGEGGSASADLSSAKRADHDGEEFLEFKEALADLRSLRHEYDCLNGGGPHWAARNKAAWARADELFADEDEAAWHRQQEDAHG